MILPLLKRDMLSGIKVFLIFFGIICMYTLIIVYMYDPKLSDMLNDYQTLLPEMMSAVGMTGIATNLLEWMQIYLYGFIMCLFPLVFVIVLIQKLLVGYLDSGAMASLLATPNSRRELIVTQMLATMIWIVILMGTVTAVGIVGAEVLFPGELDVKHYIMLNACTMLLQFAVAGIAFFAACLCSEAKQYYMFGAGIPLIFFLMQMISNMGEKLEVLKYFTIYSLLPAADIVQGQSGYWMENVILSAIAVVLFTAGGAWFCRRDIAL